MSDTEFTHNKIEFEYADLEEAFPTVDCQHEAAGCYVIVQLRTPKTMTRGGIILSDDSQAVERDNTQAAKVIHIGTGAFRDRFTGDSFAEGPWYKIGDFVRAPKYGGDRWQISYDHVEAEKTVHGIVVPAKKTKTDAFFAEFKDTDIRARVTGDPRRIKSFL